MQKQNLWRRPQAVLLVVALALGIGGISFAAGHLENPAAVLKLANADEGLSRTGFAPVMKKVLPVVVSVSSSKVSKVPTEFFGQLPDDPMFRQFFGNSNRQFSVPQQARNRGNGVLVRA